MDQPDRRVLCAKESVVPGPETILGLCQEVESLVDAEPRFVAMNRRPNRRGNGALQYGEMGCGSGGDATNVADKVVIISEMPPLMAQAVLLWLYWFYLYT